MVNQSPLGFFKKGGKTRPIMPSGLGTPSRTVGSKGALPKGSLFGSGGKLSLNLFKRSGNFAFSQAKKFNKEQEQKEKLQEDQFETQENIDDVLEQIDQIEVDEEKEIATARRTSRTPQEAKKKIDKIMKSSDKDQDKERKKLEKEQEKEKKTIKQINANADRISQITLILKPSRFT